jgi:hypothetical protein
MNNCSELTIWTSITEENVAACDSDFFDTFGGVSAYAQMINDKYPDAELTFSCLPEPYSGNPNSNVYCLNKNPGAPDRCFSEDKGFEMATMKNLALKQETCFWADGIYNKCGKLHDGIKWLKLRTRKLEEILNRQPNIFFVEYFPYHSSKGFDFPAHLPSYQFTNILIEEAIRTEKMIIIMREKGNWIHRAKNLEGYKNLYWLKCAQGGYLTPDNIVRKDSKGKIINITEKEIKKYF